MLSLLFSRHPGNMKTPAVSLLLGVSVLLTSGLTVSAVSLNVRPNLQQFFSRDPVSLSCVEDGQTVDGTVKRTRGGNTQDCRADHQDFGVFQNSSCVLDLLLSYTGLYWCETSSGQRSDQINISVQRKEDVPFILEIPALPVMTGSDVTLRCKYKDNSTRAAYFFKNNKVIEEVKVQEFVISNVQQSDEGFYKCSTDFSDPSPQSRLRVKDPVATSPPPTTTILSSSTGNSAVSSTTSLPPPTSPSPPPTPPPPPPRPPACVSATKLVLQLMAFCPYCVCTGLLVSICWSRKSGNKLVVSMEITRRGEDDELDEESDYVFIHVTNEED